MTRIDYYILDTQALEQRNLFACRLTEKALSQGLRVYLHTDDRVQAEAMDALLWSFRPDSFVPHDLYGDGSDQPSMGAGQPPALIGWLPESSVTADVLINLSIAIPSFFSRFERVAEIIVQHPSVRDPGRENFRFYKSRGYAVHDHRIT